MILEKRIEKGMFYIKYKPAIYDSVDIGTPIAFLFFACLMLIMPLGIFFNKSIHLDTVLLGCSPVF